jgi:hypothetical protein
MSQSKQSTAAVVRVKGVSFNYLQFLWSQIGQVRSVQSQGNFAAAMKLVTSLIPYLPASMKDEFREKAQRIEESMNTIRSGRLREVQAIPDFFIRGIFKNRLLQTYANAALSKFVDDLTTKLDKMGYMENVKSVPEGTGEVATEDSWLKLQTDKENAGKRRGKKGDSPTGSMD